MLSSLVSLALRSTLYGKGALSSLCPKSNVSVEYLSRVRLDGDAAFGDSKLVLDHTHHHTRATGDAESLYIRELRGEWPWVGSGTT